MWHLRNILPDKTTRKSTRFWFKNYCFYPSGDVLPFCWFRRRKTYRFRKTFIIITEKKKKIIKTVTSLDARVTLISSKYLPYKRTTECQVSAWSCWVRNKQFLHNVFFFSTQSEREVREEIGIFNAFRIVCFQIVIHSSWIKQTNKSYGFFKTQFFFIFEST